MFTPGRTDGRTGRGQRRGPDGGGMRLGEWGVGGGGGGQVMYERRLGRRTRFDRRRDYYTSDIYKNVQTRTIARHIEGGRWAGGRAVGGVRASATAAPGAGAWGRRTAAAGIFDK